MKTFQARLVFVVVAVATLAGSASSAATLSFSDKATWQASLVSSTDFAINPDNLALANELSAPPAVDDPLNTGLLTFESGNTGLSTNFTFAVDPTEEVPGTDHDLILTGNGLGVLTPGDAEHDWNITLPLGSNVFAVGITVLGNGSFEDGFLFQDQAGLNLAVFSPGTNGPTPAFLGVISDTPIWRIVYQDTNITGGRVLQEISFGQTSLATVPLPATLPLLAAVLAVLGLAGRRGPPRFP